MADKTRDTDLKSDKNREADSIENAILSDNSVGNFNRKMSLVFSKKGILSLFTLILMIGIGATVIATQRSTEYRQRASESPYQVVPVIYLPSDFNHDKNSYITQVKESFQDVALWYKEKIGKTFSLGPPVVYQSNLTSSQLIGKYPDSLSGFASGWLVRYEMPTALASNEQAICDTTKMYYFVTPLDVNYGGAGGREFFGCERFPGQAYIPGHMGRLLGGIIDPNWPEWWARETRQARGGVAHEIGHLLGAYCDDTGCNLTPHNQDPNSIMNAWWDYRAPGKNVTLNQEEQGYINRSSMKVFLSENPPVPFATSTPTPTPTIQPTLTPTPTVSPTISPPINITPTITPTPTPTPRVTATPAVSNVSLKLAIGLDGIGNSGDNTNRSDTSGSNKNPLTLEREVEVEVYDARNVLLDRYHGHITYDSSLGLFVGDVNLSMVPSGTYMLRIKTEGYLKKRVPGFISIENGRTYGLPRLDLIAGDINNDNILNIQDYNILESCIFRKDTKACDEDARYDKLSDLTDNGIKDILDYGLFLREVSARDGD